MATSPSQRPSTSTTIAFFGATGGCTNGTVVHAIHAGYHISALVRTPDKLRKQLLDQGITEQQLDTLVNIVQGSTTDIPSIKQTLIINGELATNIVTGVGGTPSMKMNWSNPLQFAAIDQPNLCETTAKNILAGLRAVCVERPASSKPLLTFISTTGITRGPEDVPVAMRFLYHQILHAPHMDKKAMEDVLRAEAAQPAERRVVRNIVGIRPTLLMGEAVYTDGVGLDKVRHGTEAQPALGYTIKRADVGHWVFANVIDDRTRDMRFEGEMISLTS